ncbi:MAG TPA: sigma-70 family RNA polymerase sigma factor [Solirubrobacterales bacterium]|nr:sigma-70 family RNA polymerase sigma factor [Solirubrobacterales bacterium]
MSEAAAPAGFSRMLSDERLTRRAVGGDERAFAAIFRRYHQSLYRFCLAIVGNPEDAQDALQNTMIKVLRALPGEERKIELKPWLYRIAHNESIDLLRRRRETRELDVEQIAPGYGLAEDAATRERLRRLLVDLRELPERQREVLVLRELSGLDFEEIGAALETSGAVARQTLYEARKSLRQMEEGREMGCDAVTRALSDGDGRVTRRRDVRAHLRSCASCRAFGDELKGRRQDLAALAPLSGVAAAGMLQGLLGGGSQAASGGGLATALGGGAAKTIGASAAAKGLATVAVVAAVGVTAADRGGVIHLGLPGESSGKSGPAAPGASHPSHEKGSSSEPGAGAGNVAGGAKTGEKPAVGSGKGETGVGSSSDQAAHGQSQARGHGHQPAEGPAVPQAQGAPAENAGGHGQEKQPSQPAAGGQETAAENKPPPDEGGAKEKDKEKEVAPDAAPAEPSSPPDSEPPAPPPKGASENPPQGAAPSLPPQAQKPQSLPGKGTEPPVPPTPAA